MRRVIGLTTRVVNGRMNRIRVRGAAVTKAAPSGLGSAMVEDGAIDRRSTTATAMTTTTAPTHWIGSRRSSSRMTLAGDAEDRDQVERCGRHGRGQLSAGADKYSQYAAV